MERTIAKNPYGLEEREKKKKKDLNRTRKE